LRTGSAIRSYTLGLTGGAGPGASSCAWTDGEGDQIYMQYAGMRATSGAFDGLNQITGGITQPP